MSGRVALIGFGLAGEAFHAPLIAAEPNLELAAVVTRDPERRAVAAARHPGIELLDSARDIWPRARDFDLVVVLHEDASDSIAALDVTAAQAVLVVVGPEGGIADEELAAFVASGGRPTRLGTTVLRSSTAGVAALSVIAARTRWR